MYILNQVKAIIGYFPKRLRDVVVHMVTGCDNTTWDAFRFSVLVGGLSMIGVFIYHAITNGNADYLTFGGGLSALLAGGGHGAAKAGDASPPKGDDQ